MAKPVRLRQLAATDINSARDYYVQHADHDVATRFVAALERATTSISRNPNQGSLRFAYELGIPDLRAPPLTRFPYLVFYVDDTTHVDVWRVLHTRRDIPTTLADTDEA